MVTRTVPNPAASTRTCLMIEPNGWRVILSPVRKVCSEQSVEVSDQCEGFVLRIPTGLFWRKQAVICRA